MEIPINSASSGSSQAETVERWAAPVAVVVVGMFMATLDITIVNVAIPAVQAEFGGSADDVLWIATAYTLTLGIIVPVTSWLGDRFGLKWLYIGALIGFAGTSALCGAATDLNVLIACRILQAIPGGILPVVTLTIVYRIVPQHQVGAAMGCYGFGAITGPAVGPVLGGFLTDHASWRLVFFINGPLGVFGALAAYFLVPKLARGTADRFDLAEFTAIASGLFAILLAASKGESWGWTGYRITGLFVFGVLCLALFVIIELQVEHPLLELRIFRIRQYALPSAIIGVFYINVLSGSFYLPVFLQQGQGKEAFVAGLLILPQAIAMFSIMPVAGMLYDRFGPRWVATFGLMLCAFGTYLLCGVSPDMTRGSLIVWSSVRAVGLGLAAMPMMTAAMAAVPPALSNQASALMNVQQQVYAAIGMAGMGALATAQQAQLWADRTAMVETGPSMGTPQPPFAPEQFALFFRAARHLQIQILSSSFSTLFELLTLITLGCALFALMLRTGKPESATAEQPDTESDTPPAAREPERSERPVRVAEPVRAIPRSTGAGTADHPVPVAGASLP